MPSQGSPGKAGAGADAIDDMDALLARISTANSERQSAERDRFLRRETSCRGVPGLPKPEDFALPRFVNADPRRVGDLVTEGRATKRSLVMDYGGKAFHEPKYLQPKTLNAWQIGRAIQPPRTYKAFRGKDYSDPRQLYRSRSTPSEFPEAKEGEGCGQMGMQHRKWLEGHRRQRKKHLDPIYYYTKNREAWEEKQAELDLKASAGGGPGGGAGDDNPGGTFGDGMGGQWSNGVNLLPSTADPASAFYIDPNPKPVDPQVGPPPIDIAPPNFKRGGKGGNYFQTDFPVSRIQEDMTMRTEYLQPARERIREIDNKRRRERETF